jgi:ubiquinone/menaquinone biosynthesis C-methylase UbiE
MSNQFDPVLVQENLYDLPYHWFPEPRLKQFERDEKRRIISTLIIKHSETKISRYLDVGCGDGRWTSDIHDLVQTECGQTPESSGIDFSERAIAFARLIKPQINYQVSPGEDIPFPDEYFDLVSAIEVIEHVQDSSEHKFLSEMKRVTQQNGLVIVTIPSCNLKVPEHHFRHYSIERFSKIASAVAFQVLDIRGQSIPYYQPTLRKTRKLFAGFPKIWRLWKYTFSEVAPEKSLNLFFALRPA